VRIPLRWWGRYLPPTVDSRNDAATSTADIDPAHLAILDQMMQWASDAGLWIILFVDSDCGQDGTQDAEELAYCDPQGSYSGGHNFWTDPDARAAFIAVWRFVADRYKGNPHLAMFEPLPEPDPITKTDADITAFYTEVTSAIRTVAPGVPFLLGARVYAIANVAAAWNPAWTDVVYTGDLWVPPAGTPAELIQTLGDRVQSLLDLRAARNVPVFVQQVGTTSAEDPGQVYMNAALSLLTQNGVGFTWWLYRDGVLPDSFGVVYDDGAGHTVTKPAVLAALEAHFAAP
jgi:hypothetical protein